MNFKTRIQSIARRYYQKLEVEDHNLLYLFLEITRKCNLNCLHCGSDCLSEVNTAELTTDSWLKIIDYICEHYSSEVTFVITGGEPLMHKDLLTIVSHIQQKKHRWGMVSNGMLLTKQMLSRLIDAGLYSITISVDGMESAHNKLRNHSFAYQKVLKAIEVVGQTDLKYKDAVTCVYPDNLYELHSIAELLIENGITSWRLFRIFPSGRAYKNPDVQLTWIQTREMLEWIKQNKSYYQNKGLNINLSCEGWLPYCEDRKLRDEPFFCRAGVNIASILSNGYITGCTNNDKTFYKGNILHDDFSYVWENNFDDFRKRKWLDQTNCINCEYKNSCKGGSIHLWRIGEKKPKFCYVKEIESF
jgi:radical SAM protein with 4Fe4S-binding SPASM domain